MRGISSGYPSASNRPNLKKIKLENDLSYKGNVPRTWEEDGESSISRGKNGTGRKRLLKKELLLNHWGRGSPSTPPQGGGGGG